MTTVVTNPVASGLRWVAGALGVLTILSVFAGINFTTTGPELQFMGTLAFVAFGLPAGLTFLLSLWLDERTEKTMSQPPELVRPANGARSVYLKTAANYAIAVICVGLAWAIRYALDPYLLAFLPFPTFFLAVAVTGWLGGFGPAVLAIALSTALARYYFMTPLHELTIDGVLTAVSISTFVTVSLVLAAVTSMLNAALRRIGQLTSSRSQDQDQA